MVQLKIQTNFVKLKFEITSPSLSDCLDNGGLFNSRLLMKGTTKCVSQCNLTNVLRDNCEVNFKFTSSLHDVRFEIDWFLLLSD